MNKKVSIGRLGNSTKRPLSMDVNRLIETRLLIQANNGAGKSWAIRCILEQTYGMVQQIVLDVEDEFHTLRQKYDYILAAPRGGAMRMLNALVKCYPMKFTKPQWATMADMTHTGGTFANYVSQLHKAGFIDEQGDYFSASEPRLPSVEFWAGLIGGTPAKILRELWNGQPDIYTKDQLAGSVGMTASGGSFNNYLSKLRVNGLVKVEKDIVIPGRLIAEGVNA